MQIFKTQHFKREHPDTPFPWYRTLSQPEAAAIRQEISNVLKLNSHDPAVLVRKIEEKAVLVVSENIDSSHFEILSLLSKCGIQSAQNVLINWNRYDDIDEIGLNDLNKYFSDIWYPGSDDIDIFDSSLKWFLSISPEGYVKLLRTIDSKSTI